MTTSDAGLNVLQDCAVHIDRVAVAGVGIREDGDVHRQHDLAGVIDHIPHTAARVWPAQLVRGGIAPGHIKNLVAQGFRHLGPNGIHATGHDEEFLLLEEFLETCGHALAFSHDDPPCVYGAAGSITSVYQQSCYVLTTCASTVPTPHMQESATMGALSQQP